MSETPLTNADFRKLLATPRPGRGSSQTPSRSEDATPRRDGDAKPKKPAYRPKPKPGAAKEEEEEEDGPKYRDRAEERRRGINPDYAAANQFSGVVGSKDVDATKLSVEYSKFLGGDLEHTHLVKGLDYSLLQQMREKEKQQREEAEKEQEQEQVAEGKTAHTVIQGRGALKREDIAINHPVAKGVYNALFAPPKANVAEMFLPRRTAFVYDWEADEFGIVQEIPTTVRRSKADCPKPVETVFARMDNAVLDSIAKIMSYIKTGKDGKRIKKKVRDEVLGGLLQRQAGGGAGAAAAGAGAGQVPATSEPAGAKPTAADEEEDIFGDAGTDYKPVVKKKEKPDKGGDDMDIETDQGMAGPAPPSIPPDQAAAMAYGHYDAYGQYQEAGQYGGYADPYNGQYGAWPDPMAATQAGGYAQQQQQQEEPRWKVRRSKAEERMVDFVDDAYGEFYPMAASLEAPIVDEDEELEGKAAKLKAAADAAAAAPKTEKETARESNQKISTQLQKIEHILKEKGHDHSGAFGKTPSRKSTGEDPSLPTSKKRQRI